jgi:hypothetical protein
MYSKAGSVKRCCRHNTGETQVKHTHTHTHTHTHKHKHTHTHTQIELRRIQVRSCRGKEF